MSKLNKHELKTKSHAFAPDRSPTGHARALRSFREGSEWFIDGATYSGPLYDCEASAVKAARKLFLCQSG